MKEKISRAAGILKEAGATEVYIFGSAAAGNLKDRSDVDVAVSGLPQALFFEAMGRAAEVLGAELDLIDLDEINPFTDYLKKKGKLERVV